jgi:glycerol uptake facilitator-like aquaporin
VSRRVLAELLGTALLVLAVVGSGIAAARLSPDDVGLQLLENALATAAALIAIILALGPVSQVLGGCLGAVAANVMYDLPVVSLAGRERAGGALWLSEVIATAGLVLIVFALLRAGRGSAAPFAIGAYIGGAYFFTSSTSFANPAVTLARTLSDTFAGIAPASAPGFIGAQLLGGVLGLAAVRILFPRTQTPGAVVPPHS